MTQLQTQMNHHWDVIEVDLLVRRSCFSPLPAEDSVFLAVLVSDDAEFSCFDWSSVVKVLVQQVACGLLDPILRHRREETHQVLVRQEEGLIGVCLLK